MCGRGEGAKGGREGGAREEEVGVASISCLCQVRPELSVYIVVIPNPCCLRPGSVLVPAPALGVKHVYPGRGWGERPPVVPVKDPLPRVASTGLYAHQMLTSSCGMSVCCLCQVRSEVSVYITVIPDRSRLKPGSALHLHPFRPLIPEMSTLAGEGRTKLLVCHSRPTGVRT